jgi:hypothetical protein
MPAKDMRTLGYTELWERMRRVIAVEGNQTLYGWSEDEDPPEYFNSDGEPENLCAYVLSGLGVDPVQVSADLLPHNVSEPREIFAAAGFPLTVQAGWLAEEVWVWEMRGKWWIYCIGELTAYDPDAPGWVPQDAVTLAEVEGTAGPERLTPEDVTAITATIPAMLPDHLADKDDYVIGYDLWMEAAERAGEGTAWTITKSTFDVSGVPVDASTGDPNVCAAVLVNYRWYAIERDGDTIRARLAPLV